MEPPLRAVELSFTVRLVENRLDEADARRKRWGGLYRVSKRLSSEKQVPTGSCRCTLPYVAIRNTKQMAFAHKISSGFRRAENRRMAIRGLPMEIEEAENTDLERVCRAVSPSNEPCDFPATVHCAKCGRWLCDAHAEDEEWHPCMLPLSDEGVED